MTKQLNPRSDELPGYQRDGFDDFVENFIPLAISMIAFAIWLPLAFAWWVITGGFMDSGEVH